MKRREIEKETRKEYILKAAEKLFLKKGYYLTTMDEIAEKSEFSKPTVYNYFMSKEDIAKHIHLKFLSGRVEFFKNAMKEISDPYEKLIAFGISYYEYANTHREEFRFQLTWDSYITKEHKVSKEVQNKIREQNEDIGTVIKDAMSRLVNKNTIHKEFDLHCTMVSFYASLRTTIAYSLFSGCDDEKKDEGRSFYINFLKIFLNGLKGGN